MLEILEKCFASEFASDAWQSKLREMIPSFGQSLIQDADLTRKMRLRSTELLELWDDEKPAARQLKPAPVAPSVEETPAPPKAVDQPATHPPA
jgi:hypothetical protein